MSAGVCTQEESQDSTDVGFVQLDEEISIKEEPMSPASSVSSKVSECDIKPGSRRGSRGGNKIYQSADSDVICFVYMDIL